MTFNFKKGDILRYTKGYHMVIEVLSWDGSLGQSIYARILEMEECTEYEPGAREVGKRYYFNPQPFAKLNGIQKAVRRLRSYSVTGC